jgi:ribosomal protein S18 acetylase RimI-like enzyme
MILARRATVPSLNENFVIVPYQPERHHDLIPPLYAESFGEPPWPRDWDGIPEFDPRGVFLAEDSLSQAAVGFVVSFKRRDFGYVSVLGVLPTARRQGLGMALLDEAVLYLKSLGLGTIKVDVSIDDTPAVRLYQRFGFEITESFDDEAVGS